MNALKRAYRDPIARIQYSLKALITNFCTTIKKTIYKQVNYFAQLAFLIYFWADRYVLPDVEVLSGVIRSHCNYWCI